MQFTSSSSSQSSIDQYLWSPSNVVVSPTNQSNQMLLKFWNNPKHQQQSQQQAQQPQQTGGHKTVPSITNVGRNAKMSGQQIVGYNQNPCDDTTNESNELDAKINEVHSPNRDYKQANSNNNTNSVNIVHPTAPKDFGCDDTYEDGIDKDMRDLERRLESELEEHEKLWSPEEETPISQT